MKHLARGKLFDSHYLWKDIAWSYSFNSNLEYAKWNLEISSSTSSFGPLILNWKVTAPCQFLRKISWNITFLELLYSFPCSSNKNIWKVWQEVNSLMHIIFENILQDLTAWIQIWNSSDKLQKLVHAAAPLLFCFFSGKSQLLASRWWKLLAILHFCSSYTLITSNNKNIGKKWQEITSWIDLIFEKLLLDLAASFQI